MCDKNINIFEYLSYFIGKVTYYLIKQCVPSHPTDGVRWDTPSGSDGTVKTICFFLIIENLDHSNIVKNVQVQNGTSHSKGRNTVKILYSEVQP